MDQHVEPIPDGSDRITAILISTSENPILLVNTYMPTEGAANSIYEEVLDEIYELLSKYQLHTCIWTGDINASDTRARPTSNDQALMKFCHGNKLTISKHTPNLPTFHHSNGRSSSKIDLFLHRQCEDPICQISVDARNPLNVSTHDSVTAELPFSPPHVQQAATCKTVSIPIRIKWDKIDKTLYKVRTDMHLRVISSSINQMPVPLIIERVNKTLVESAQAAAPKRPIRLRKTKFKWHPSLTAAAKRANQCYRDLKTTSSQDPNLSQRKATLQAAKKLLRKAQRQLAAKQRREYLQSIMDSCQGGSKTTFYRLIRKQRSHNDCPSTIRFGEHEKAGDEAGSWANYFAHLATPVNDECFDDKYQRHLQITHLLQVLTTETTECLPATHEEVAKHIQSLQNGKSMDIFGICAEHIKFSSPVIVDILCHLINEVLKSGKLPDILKVGSITPVPKKSKNPREPNSYRRITITSIIGKVIEKEMLQRIRTSLDRNQSRLQFGFTPGVSPLYAALILTEVMSEARDTKEPTIITFMDTSKAFDVVAHPNMLHALHSQGVKDSLWHLFSSLYSGPRSAVKWGNTMSDPFLELQGIRQGGTSSADCYKAGKNHLLSQLDNLSTYKIGSINVSAAMVADDLALVSHTATDMQKAIKTAEIDASRDRYRFNCDKTKFITVNTKLEPHLTLNGTQLQTSSVEKHLGILRNSKNNNMDTVQERVKDARRATYGLMGAGMHGLNGVGPDVSLTQYKTYILPILLYGLEALVLSAKESEILELFHRKCLRYIQHLPPSTAIPAIHLLAGIPPVRAMLDIQSLKLFQNIMNCTNCNSPSMYMRELITRQLGLKDCDSSSWVTHIRQLLYYYELPTAFDIIHNTPTKLEWKRSVQKAVNDRWTKDLREKATEMSSLAHLNTDNCRIGSLHPVWAKVDTTMEVQQATVMAQLLCGRYPLATSLCHGKRQRVIICPICHTEPETLEHFLLQCPNLTAIRSTYLPAILNVFREQHLCVNPSNVLQCIVDSTCAPTSDADYIRLCRRFVYRMHRRRTLLLKPE
jgi:hypothetical protein